MPNARIGDLSNVPSGVPTSAALVEIEQGGVTYRTSVSGLASRVSTEQPGITSHGALTGLANDDHTQYLNAARHASTNHTSVVAALPLSTLSNVSATAPTSGQSLVWNGTAWAPATITGGGGGGDVVISGTPIVSQFAQWLDANTLRGISASLARTELSLVVGTDVQAFSSVLQQTTAAFTTAKDTKLSELAPTSVLTQSQYTALPTKDPSTLYFVTA